VQRARARRVDTGAGLGAAARRQTARRSERGRGRLRGQADRERRSPLAARAERPREDIYGSTRRCASRPARAPSALQRPPPPRGVARGHANATHRVRVGCRVNLDHGRRGLAGKTGRRIGADSRRLGAAAAHFTRARARRSLSQQQKQKSRVRMCVTRCAVGGESSFLFFECGGPGQKPSPTPTHASATGLSLHSSATTTESPSTLPATGLSPPRRQQQQQALLPHSGPLILRLSFTPHSPPLDLRSWRTTTTSSSSGLG
jgi:hypothetical protein